MSRPDAPAIAALDERARLQRNRHTPLVLCLALLAAILGAWSLARFCNQHVGHDQAWGLYLGMQTLSGVQLNGPYLTEVNPPFLVWFMSLPVFLSRLLHVDVLTGFRCFLVLTGGACVLWSLSLFRRILFATPVAVWLFALAQIVTYGIMILPVDFGQREHFVAFFLLPYLLWAAGRLRGSKLAPAEVCALGLLAAVAICLKPQHMLDVALVELVLLVRLRSWRAWFDLSWVVLGVSLAVYFVAVRVAAPAYLTDIVPVLKETYWGFDASWRFVLLQFRKPVWYWVPAVGLAFALRRWLRSEALVTLLLTASVGAAVAYLQQHKGWHYQLIVFNVFTCLALAQIGAEWFERMIADRLPAFGPRLAPAVPALGAALLCAVVALPLIRHHPLAPYGEPPKQVLADVFSAYPAGSAVTFYSAGPWEFPALVEQNKLLGTRYFHMWLLEAVIRSQNVNDFDLAKHLSPLRAAQLGEVLRQTEAEDLAHFQPVVVVVDRCAMREFCEAEFQGKFPPLIDWLQVSSAFREQWKRYRFQKSIGDLDVYERSTP